MSTTLPLFWHLSSASRKERIDASATLVSSLEKFQVGLGSKRTGSGTDVEEEEEDEEGGSGKGKSDELDALNSTDVAYSIRRLIRGLASPRESSRLGFAVVLSELLSRLKTVTCAQIVMLIQTSTKPQGSMTGQDERDVLFAQLFGLTSVIESRLCVMPGVLATSASSSTEISTQASFNEIISQLVELGDKKSWLRESAWFSISLALDALQQSEVEWKDEAVSAILSLLFCTHEAWSPEKVAIAVKLQNMYPDRAWGELLVPPFKSPLLLSRPNLLTLALILKESPASDESGKDIPKAPSGSWKPQLHFVWDVLLRQILSVPTASATASFQEFFRIVVDASLFFLTSSLERKYWGFQVFQKALKQVNHDDIPLLFTKNFMRTWINHLSHRDRYLHKMAQQTASDVQSLAKNNPQLGFSLILQLTGPHGSQQFDKLTRTKTVESILSTMDVAGIENYVEYLFSQANETEKGERMDIQVTNARRSWVLDQLGALFRNGAVPKDDAWVQSVLDWLVVRGLFVVKRKTSKSPFKVLHSVPNPAFSDELQHSCRMRLLSCLCDLSSRAVVVKADEKSTKVHAVASDGEFWVAKVLKSVKQLEADTKHVSLAVEIDEQDHAKCAEAMRMAEELGKITDQSQESAQGGQLLLLASTIHRYCVNDSEEDIDSDALESCMDCTSRMFPNCQRERHKSSADDADTNLEPVDVFVDTIIGFLEKSTAYMRTIGNQVFSLLSGSVKDSTIDLIVAQLERRAPGEDLSDGDESMEDEQGNEEDEDEDEDESESDEADVESPDEGDEDIDPELRKNVEEALRVNGIERANDGDNDEEEDEPMDDEQMLALDDRLAAVFRSQMGDRKSGKASVGAQREATHFKNRILDLVDTFLKRQPSSPYVVRLILPLVELIVGSGQDERQPSDKAKGILRSRIGKAKTLPTSVDPVLVTECLKTLHARARQTHSADTLAILSACSIYLSKILSAAQSDDVPLDEYRQSLVDFLTRKNSALNTAFIQEYLRRFPAAGWRLRSDLLDLSGRAVNVYRQSQAYHLLEGVICQLPSNASADDVTVFMKSLRKGLLSRATDVCADKSSVTAKDLFKLAIIAVKQTKRIAPASTEDIWDASSWAALEKSLAGSTRFKTSHALHKMCKQIALSSQSKAKETSGTLPSKRKAQENVEEKKVGMKKAKRVISKGN